MFKVFIWLSLIFFTPSHRLNRLCIPPSLLTSAYRWLFFFAWLDSPSGPGHLLCISTITLRHTTLGRTPVEEWSARRRDLYLTTQNTHNRQTSMPPTGFEPAIPASERTYAHTLDRAATEIGARRFLSHGNAVVALKLNPHLHWSWG